MKINNSISVFALASLICLLIFSCTLEEEILDESTGEELLAQEDIEINLIAPAYGRLTGIVGCCGIFAINEVSSDELIVAAKGRDWFDNGSWIELHQHTWSPFQGNILGSWNGLEGAIGTANTALFLLQERADKIPENELKGYQAELRFLRAYYRYHLLDLFRQVPMRDEFDQDFSNPPEVFNATETYGWLVSELESIIPDLSDHGAITYGRVSQQAAYTLLAKLHLNAEVYTGTAKWQKCIEACDQVINSEYFDLSDDYFQIFSFDNDAQNSEAIFVVRQSLEVQNRAFFTPSFTLHYSHNLGQGKFGFNGFATVEEFFYRWDMDNDVSNGVQTTDLRFKDERIMATTGANLGFLEGPQFNPDGSPVPDPQLSGQTGSFVQLDYTPNISNIINAAQHEGVRVIKYEPDPLSDNILRGRNDFILFRYADIWLMKAEAMHRTQQGGALNMVNMLRQKRGVPNLDELTDQALLDERGFEFYWEGYRRQDLVRFDQFTKGSWAFKEVTDDTRNVFPIPQQLLNINENLVQNPGY